MDITGILFPVMETSGIEDRNQVIKGSPKTAWLYRENQWLRLT